MFKDKLREFVDANPKLVSKKPAGNGIYILKYKKTVFYNDLWNEYLEHCRGTIVDEDFNLVSYPFQKIYNYGIERAAPVLDDNTDVLAYRKVNGFMVSATWYNGDILVSTTGSTDSDFVAMAKEMMLTHQSWPDWQLAFANRDLQGLTFMFEACHKNDPHIIPEQAGMYVLGYRENSWRSKVGRDPAVLQSLGDMFNCFVPESYTVGLAELKRMVKECRHEGYVAYTQDGVSFKIKSPFYLTNKWVARNPRTDKLVDLRNDIKRTIDEEYHSLVDKIRACIVQYTKMNEQDRLAWVRNELTDKG